MTVHANKFQSTLTGVGLESTALATMWSRLTRVTPLPGSSNGWVFSRPNLDKWVWQQLQNLHKSLFQSKSPPMAAPLLEVDSWKQMLHQTETGIWIPWPSTDQVVLGQGLPAGHHYTQLALLEQRRLSLHSVNCVSLPSILIRSVGLPRTTWYSQMLLSVAGTPHLPHTCKPCIILTDSYNVDHVCHQIPKSPWLLGCYIAHQELMSHQRQ